MSHYVWRCTECDLVGFEPSFTAASDAITAHQVNQHRRKDQTVLTFRSPMPPAPDEVEAKTRARLLHELEILIADFIEDARLAKSDGENARLRCMANGMRYALNHLQKLS